MPKGIVNIINQFQNIWSVIVLTLDSVHMLSVIDCRGTIPWEKKVFAFGAFFKQWQVVGSGARGAIQFTIWWQRQQ